ncbi:hypothetical protein [Nocardia sp. alder85J]|uniref:hypothetical protein n=1 Tax=Nocardia sp. alder85J TaxID=2862949 RepID=UPI001CD2E1DF|nr:hypothetical protein [Nocardia sp. alder85J]MCX4094729.1 hypothetical protein [Nocardia sp. alder85J]
MNDEDTWVVPKRWLARAEPFRGVTGHRPIEAAPTAPLTRVVERQRERIIGLLGNGRREGNAEPADAGMSWLDHLESPGRTEPSALGAAAVATILTDDQNSCCSSMVRHGRHVREELAAPMVEGWVSAGGIGFAVDVLTHAGRLTVDRRVEDPGGWTPWRRRSYHVPWYDVLSCRPQDEPWWGMHSEAARLIRAHLAAASDTEYAAAVGRVEALRDTGPVLQARMLSSYLLPERQDWLEADLADQRAADQRSWTFDLLVPAVTTAAQLDRIGYLKGGAPMDMHTLFPDKAPLFNVVCQVGPAAAPTLARLLDTCHSSKDRAFVAGVLSQLPSDDAFLALLQRRQFSPVAAALKKAAARYPRRAHRLTVSAAAT